MGGSNEIRLAFRQKGEETEKKTLGLIGLGVASTHAMQAALKKIAQNACKMDITR